ncbi:patatin-like phospholipase family protein [Rhodoplanes sp. Z2-YC6860]|uniref:patatin-like phospholipase family protein n=1 Tax=Rhodoplanes sp. Z2-YC6860 TaxID=674703 RepID=UPI00078D43FD|nr:patatin-like phospholipase family protein [Rhodoplanes sp. Z2-YC6860]AMN41195.1 patatin [Rhodoplanes sp. Z2-YC6860]
MHDEARGRNGERGAKATTEAPERKSERPTIALALGGGGARGFAHIGVIRCLLAHGIEPDIIVGTSIGAVIGGCYASGRLDLIEEWALGLTRRGILGYLDISLTGGGLIGGGKLAARLEEQFGDTAIESLPIRFATIATEVGTGHEIWLTRGRMVEAVRASYALPGIFPPVFLDGRWLVDGALVNPVPVSAARVFGARLVIAVNLNSDVLGRGTIMAGESAKPQPEPNDPAPEAKGLLSMFGVERALKRQFFGGTPRPSIPTVMVDAFNIMQDRIARARLAGDPPDVMINPRLGHVGWFDFHRAQEAIDIGTRVAERAMDEINEAIAALAPRPAPITPAVE